MLCIPTLGQLDDTNEQDRCGIHNRNGSNWTDVVEGETSWGPRQDRTRKTNGPAWPRPNSLHILKEV